MSWETTVKVLEYIYWSRIITMVGYVVLWAAGFTLGWWVCRSRFEHVSGPIYRKVVKTTRKQALEESRSGVYSYGATRAP